MPPLHPMPPSPGGGVERLVDILLRANDDASEPLDITVFSRFDERAKAAAEGYRHTKFVWLNTTRSEPLSISSSAKSEISSDSGCVNAMTICAR